MIYNFYICEVEELYVVILFQYIKGLYFLLYYYKHV